MKTYILFFELFILLFISCKKDESYPAQPPPNNTDTVSTITPGTAIVDFMIHFQWSDARKYGQSTICEMRGDTISVRSFFSLMGNSYSFEMLFRIPSDTSTITLDSNSIARINYTRVLYGYPENWTTRDRLGGGRIVVTYLSSTSKTIKGTFEGTIVLIGSTTVKEITGGIFKATWQ